MVVVQASIVQLSVNSLLLETAACIQAKFYGTLPNHHISRFFFFFFKIFTYQIFTIFSLFLLTWDPIGEKNLK